MVSNEKDDNSLNDNKKNLSLKILTFLFFFILFFSILLGVIFLFLLFDLSSTKTTDLSKVESTPVTINWEKNLNLSFTRENHYVKSVFSNNVNELYIMGGNNNKSNLIPFEIFNMETKKSSIISTKNDICGENCFYFYYKENNNPKILLVDLYNKPVVAIFDINSKKIKKLNSTPQKRAKRTIVGICLKENFLYVWGGINIKTNLPINQFEIIDINKDEKIPTKLSVNKSGGTIIPYSESEVLLIGGKSNKTGEALREIDKINLQSENISKFGNLELPMQQPNIYNVHSFAKNIEDNLLIDLKTKNISVNSKKFGSNTKNKDKQRLYIPENIKNFDKATVVNGFYPNKYILFEKGDKLIITEYLTNNYVLKEIFEMPLNCKNSEFYEPISENRKIIKILQIGGKSINQKTSCGINVLKIEKD